MAIELKLTEDELFAVTKWAWVYKYNLVSISQFYSYAPKHIKFAIRSAARCFKGKQRELTPNEWRTLIKVFDMSPECARAFISYA